VSHLLDAHLLERFHQLLFAVAAAHDVLIAEGGGLVW
jgi:hypothetical protein